MTQDTHENKVVFVTGANRGIGKLWFKDPKGLERQFALM